MTLDPKDSERHLLGRNLWGLHIIYMLKRDESMSEKIKQILFITFSTMVVSMGWVELWVVRSDANKAFNNMSFTIPTTVSYLKYITFILGTKQWTSVFKYITEADIQNRSRRNDKVNAIVQKYTNYSTNVDYVYAYLVSFTVLVTAFSPFLTLLFSPEKLERVTSGLDPYPEILSSWIPFDKTRGYGYCVLLILQILEYGWGAGVIWCYDTTVFKIMMFFAAQFKLLALRCENIFEDEKKILPSHEVFRRIKECHTYHVILLKYIEIFAGLWMPVLFFYVIVCSLSICACTVRLTSQSTSGMDQLFLAQFLLAWIIQLFLYCWYSTDVSFTSNGVEYSVFKSSWVTQEVRVRRSLMLLAGQLRRKVIFRAGPFTEMNVATFITIMKGSYSYYTLLNEKKALN